MKTILITGSTDGIGKLAAEKLAREGHFVYLHGRNPEKLQQVVSDLKKRTGNKNLGGFVADFSKLTAVKHMVKEVHQAIPKLDVLINNAGVYKSAKPNNEDGLDLRFVVNYFAPYLLTEGLLPLLKKGEEPRLLNLSSAAQSPIAENVLLGKDNTTDSNAYAQSKLAITLWSFYLAKKLEGVNVLAVNPGSLLNTNMVKEAFGTHWAPADKGAALLYQLATAEDYKNSSGQYFDNDQGAFGKAHADAYNEQKIERLIQLTKQVLDR